MFTHPPNDAGGFFKESLCENDDNKEENRTEDGEESNSRGDVDSEERGSGSNNESDADEGSEGENDEDCVTESSRPVSWLLVPAHEEIGSVDGRSNEVKQKGEMNQGA
ncbi:hypothetical protein B0H11DRAFT_1903070 [Mycena galericulata]|nr:hypothetical protein B0H11DRAFT_1903070 [Mycena galericulata]